MKKHGISKRILAMMLVLCMAFTMLPANMNAAEKPQGTIEETETGFVEDSFNYESEIKLPIEIYDYENDGMLFEYAGATGNKANRDELDKKGEYVYMPDMKTDYYADYTSDAIKDSYVVTDWFNRWSLSPSQVTDQANGLKYYKFTRDESETDYGYWATELIDFKDNNSDGIDNDLYGAATNPEGDYVFSNAYGYTFSVKYYNKPAEYTGEITMLLTPDYYPEEGYTWAVKIVLAPGGDGKYRVVQKVDSGVELKQEDVNRETGNEIILIVHSDGDQHADNCDNWMDKVAARALEEGNIVTIDENHTTVTVEGTPTNTTKTAPKEDIRYAVLVYRVSDLENKGRIEVMLRGEEGANKYFGDYKKIAATGDEGDSGWAYCVLNLELHTQAIGNASEGEEIYAWEEIEDNIASAGIRFATLDSSDYKDPTADTDGYEFMISHFALFSSEGEAEAYGEKALVYNKHHIHEVYPEAEYSADYTTSEMNTSSLKTEWWNDDYGLTDYSTNTALTENYYVEKTETSGRKYYTFQGLGSLGVDLIDLSTFGGAESEKVQYAVLVCRTSGIDGNITFNAFVRGDQGKSNTVVCNESYAHGMSGNWFKLIFDLSEVKGETTKKEYSTITGAGIQWTLPDNDAYASFGLDISHFALVSSKAEAEAYAKQAITYNGYTETPTAYYNPLYSNLGYGLLVGSHDSYFNAGATLAYDKYDERIGYTFIPENIYDEAGTTVTDTQFEEAHSSLSDMIYFLEAGKGSDLDKNTNETPTFSYDGKDMKDLPFDGYLLFATLTEGSMTAGLIESALKDGNPVYREEVIDYLANLMASTLIIPEYKDGRFNYDFIRGEKKSEYAGEDRKERDLASAIRERVGINFDTGDTEVNDKVTLVINGENDTYGVDQIVKVTKGPNTITRIINGTEVTTKLELDKEEYKAGVLAAMINGDKLRQRSLQASGWELCEDYIETCYDAAYFLLNNIFVASSYNEPKYDYDHLVLHEVETTDGDVAYVFDAGFSKENINATTGYESALKYDAENKIIDFADVTGKGVYYYADDISTTLFPFLPITDGNNETDMTKSPYFADDGVGYDGTFGGTYWERDFNYVMKSSGVFVYHDEDDLFFEFEGDDDVYLFINGELVLDIGGAHSITKERINIDDYVAAAKEGIAGNEARNKALDLEEGEVCTFDFFYMERHGYGANCRIVTNMRVTDSGLKVDKTASQNDAPVLYGGSVNATDLIAYDFAATNNGNVKLYHMTFKDANIGVTIDYKNGLVIEDETKPYVLNSKGEELHVSDLRAVVTGFKVAESTDTGDRYKKTDAGMVKDKDGIYVETDPIYVSFANNDALKKFMETLEGDKLDTDESSGENNEGYGLWAYSTVKIEGIHYKLTDEQVKNKVFDNMLSVEAETIPVGSEVSKNLSSQDTHRVYVSNELTYYQWAGNQLEVSQGKLLQDLIDSVANIWEGKVKSITLLDENENEVVNHKDGSVYTEGDWDNGWKMMINYSAPVNDQFNIKLNYMSGELGQDSDEDGIDDTFGVNKESDTWEFDNAYGYTFNIDEINGSIGLGEKTIVIDKESAYTDCNPLWAVSIHLRPTDISDVYEVVQNPIVNPKGFASNKDPVDEITAEEAGIYWTDGDIVIVIHSNGDKDNDGYANWMDKVAAKALKQGDRVTYSKNGSSSTITVNADRIIPITAIVRDVEDSAYVLDYGLSVNLVDENGLFSNDSLIVDGRDTKAKLLAIGTNQPSYTPNNISFAPVDATEENEAVFEVSGTEGMFKFGKESQKLKYTPTEFMNAEDNIYVAVLVHDAQYNSDEKLGEVNINKEVQMYKEVSVLPANVVYYEDDFPAIHYKNGENLFTSVNEFKHEGSSADLTQSTNQDQEYGQDDAYSKNDVMSGNSLTKIKINAHGPVAYFDFTGTGLELIGQTNAKDSAIFSMQVCDSKGNQVRNIPVITEFDNNADGENDSDEDKIYQVPVIRINDLPYGTYRVNISGIASKDFTQNPAKVLDTYLYIDGIRIFQPLENDSEAVKDHYNETEKGATFAEIRDLILNGQAAVATYSKETSEETFKVSTGTVTWTENRNNTFEGNSVSSANDYLMFGPNNEVYMAKESGEDNVSALIFYVKETDAKNHNLQIAFRAIDAGLYKGGEAEEIAAEISYGIDYNGKKYWTEAIPTTTATEQYYTIQYDKCPYIDDKGYQVAIKVNEGMISYTSLKYNGLELANLNAYQEGEIPNLIYKDGVLVEKSTGDVADINNLPELDNLKLQFIAKDTISFDEIDQIEAEKDNPIRYQTRNNKDVRLIAYVDDLSKYTKVTFEIKIPNGEGGYKTSNPLVCTTAYNKLWAGNNEKTTEDIYNKDGYFVTFVINNFLTAYSGDVEITVRYYQGDEEIDSDTRTVSIGTEENE